MAPWWTNRHRAAKRNRNGRLRRSRGGWARSAPLWHRRCRGGCLGWARDEQRQLPASAAAWRRGEALVDGGECNAAGVATAATARRAPGLGGWKGGVESARRAKPGERLCWLTKGGPSIGCEVRCTGGGAVPPLGSAMAAPGGRCKAASACVDSRPPPTLGEHQGSFWRLKICVCGRPASVAKNAISLCAP